MTDKVDYPLVLKACADTIEDLRTGPDDAKHIVLLVLPHAKGGGTVTTSSRADVELTLVMLDYIFEQVSAEIIDNAIAYRTLQKVSVNATKH